MTEATGGILMTSPGAYVEGSIGRPLPGVDCRRADDGELLIRGVYISPGYYGGEQVMETGLDADGWFHTGDLVSVDAEGHYRITGRKKEIYKNRAGQTIAPQRVENLFRDFDAVGQAFLVGRSPRVQHPARLAQTSRSSRSCASGLPKSCASSSPRSSRAPTASSPRSSGWWRSRSCPAPSTRRTAS